MQGEYVIMKKGFDANKYIEEQSKYILERIKKATAKGCISNSAANSFMTSTL